MIDSDTQPDNQQQEPSPTPAEPVTFDLDTEVIGALIAALDSGDHGRVHALCDALHASEVADVIEQISSANRAGLMTVLGDRFDADTLAELDDTVREEVIEYMGVKSLAQALTELDSDDAVDVLTELDEEDQRQILEAIPLEDRTFIEESLKYPDDSAGRLMQRELVSVPEFWSIGETIDYMRHSAEDAPDTLPTHFYDIFIVDATHRPVGAVPLSLLLRTRRPVKMSEIMATGLHIIPVETDQEEVAYLFRQRDLVSAPVVDAGGRLVGAITIDDVVDVIDDEHEEDMMRLAGVGEDDLYDAAIDTTRSRFSWLLINLATAVLASVVIGMFEASIQQIIALAVLMPIVASMGGNAGTQTLTVAVRGLATKELTSTNALRVMTKELIVGCFNGVLFALIAGTVAWYWFDDVMLGVVIGLAMVINMVVAALAGTAVPIMLDRVNIDPAIASSVFVTTVTDVVGFFAFLGLAAWILF